MWLLLNDHIITDSLGVKRSGAAIPPGCFLSSGLHTEEQINIFVFFSSHVLHFGCEGPWQWGQHLTRLPFGTAHSCLAIGQHPWVQSFLPHFHSNR